MSNDLIFNIGGDNSNLERSNNDAQRLIDDWLLEVEGKFNEFRGFEIDTDPAIKSLDDLGAELDTIRERLDGAKQAARDLDNERLESFAEALETAGTLLENVGDLLEKTRGQSFEVQQEGVDEFVDNLSETVSYTHLTLPTKRIV